MWGYIISLTRISSSIFLTFLFNNNYKADIKNNEVGNEVEYEKTSLLSQLLIKDNNFYHNESPLSLNRF